MASASKFLIWYQLDYLPTYLPTFFLLIELTYENSTTFFCIYHTESEQAKFSIRETKIISTLKKPGKL